MLNQEVSALGFEEKDLHLEHYSMQMQILEFKFSKHKMIYISFTASLIMLKRQPGNIESFSRHSEHHFFNSPTYLINLLGYVAVKTNGHKSALQKANGPKTIIMTPTKGHVLTENRLPMIYFSRYLVIETK